MKKKLLAVLFAGILSVSAVTPAFAAEAAETETVEGTEEETEEAKLLGEDAEGAFHVQFKNGTGKDIKSVKINVPGKVTYEQAENLLKEEDVFAADEERLLCFLPEKEEVKEEEQKDETEEKKEAEIPVYNLKFTFADDTTAEIHTFPFGDIESGELKLEGELAYLIFESVSLKETVNTLETETKIADEIKAAKEAAEAAAAAQSYDDYYEDYDYDYDYDYSYDGGGSSSGGSSGGGSSSGGGEDSCLTGGLLN